MSNHWMRRVRTMVAANGPADSTSAARCPAIHCRRTSSASWPCTEAVSANVPDEIQHRYGRLRLAFVGSGLAIGRIGHDAPASLGHGPAGEEVDAGFAEAAPRDVGGHHPVAVRGKHRGHGTGAAAWLPDRSAKAH